MTELEDHFLKSLQSSINIIFFGDEENISKIIPKNEAIKITSDKEKDIQIGYNEITKQKYMFISVKTKRRLYIYSIMIDEFNNKKMVMATAKEINRYFDSLDLKTNNS